MSELSPEDILETAYALQIIYDPDNPNLHEIKAEIEHLQTQVDTMDRTERDEWEAEIRASRKRKRSVPCHETITVISKKEIDLMSEAQLVYFPMVNGGVTCYYPLDAVTDVKALLQLNLNPFTNKPLTIEETDFLETAQQKHKYPRIDTGDFFEEIDERLRAKPIYLEKEYQRKLRQLVSLIETTGVIVYELAQIYNFATECDVTQYNLFLRHKPLNQKIPHDITDRDSASAITLNHILNYISIQSEQLVSLVSIAYAIDEFMYFIHNKLTYDQLLHERGEMNELAWKPDFIQEDYYENGSLKYRYQIDEADHFHGPYKRWYRNGVLAYESMYTHNIESDIIRYYGSGELCCEGNIYYYPNGLVMARLNGGYELFDDDGNLLGSGIIITTNQEIGFQNVEGQIGCIIYLSDHLITSIQICHHDEPHGLQMTWTIRGYLRLRTRYFNGKLQGESESWYPNGQMDTYGLYDDDNRIDLWESWYENGNLKSQTYYEHDMKHGLSRTYYDDGITLQTHGYYDKDKALGIHQQFHKNGQLLRENYYYEGFKYGLQEEWNSEGLLIGSGLYNHNERDGLWMHIEHKIKTYGYYKNGSKDGTWKSLMNDFIFLEENYHYDNSLHGLQTKYYPNGNLFYQGYYDNGLPYGHWTYFYPNGQLAGSGNYFNRNPLFKIYDPDGNEMGESYITRGHGVSFYNYNDNDDYQRHGITVINTMDMITVRYYLNDQVQDYSMIWTWEGDQMTLLEI